jgi:SIR2-like domain
MLMAHSKNVSLLEDNDWLNLLRLIKKGKCTPFIGAGACADVLPIGKEIANKWAKTYNYPLKDSDDLARVAQFVAIEQYDMFPKEEIIDQFEGAHPPNFSELDEPHSALAILPLHVYITTNYDDFMVQALKKQNKEAVRDFCAWNKYLEDLKKFDPNLPSSSSPSSASSFVNYMRYSPNSGQPLVYHLHGYTDVAQSMVVTESDYLDFLIYMVKNWQGLLPAVVRTALSGAALLFVGYSLADWNFRVLLRGIISSHEANLTYPAMAVQLPPDNLNDVNLDKAIRYLDKYFGNIPKIKVKIYWGTTKEFSKELRQRWERFM